MVARSEDGQGEQQGNQDGPATGEAAFCLLQWLIRAGQSEEGVEHKGERAGAAH